MVIRRMSVFYMCKYLQPSYRSCTRPNSLLRSEYWFSSWDHTSWPTVGTYWVSNGRQRKSWSRCTQDREFMGNCLHPCSRLHRSSRIRPTGRLCPWSNRCCCQLCIFRMSSLNQRYLTRNHKIEQRLWPREGPRLIGIFYCYNISFSFFCWFGN